MVTSETGTVDTQQDRVGLVTKTDYEEILQHIGPCGRFQLHQYLKLCLCCAAAGMGVVVFIFTGLTPDYRCHVPECESPNATYHQYQVHDSLILPVWYNGTLSESQKCRIPKVEMGQDGVCLAHTAHWTDDTNGSECSLNELVMDRSVVTSSVVEEYELVCGRYWLRAVYSSLYMIGMLFGSYFFGWVSDTYGRVRSLQLSIVFISLAGFLSTFCTFEGGVHIYGILRVITGMGGMGVFLVPYVLLLEHVGSKFRIPVAAVLSFWFTIGTFILAFLAYMIRDWQTLQMAAHIPMIGVLIPVWFASESPRWLISKGRLEEAEQIIREVARTNNKNVPEHLLRKTPSPGEEVKSRSETTVLDMFRNWKIGGRSLLMCYQWAATSMCYYGLTFTATSLSSGGAYANFTLGVAVELPAYIFNLIALDSWGRRPILSFLQVVSGISCIFCGLLMGNTDPGMGSLQICLFLLGKVCAACGFGVVYVYSTELFPTVIRNQAVGLCSLSARIGAVAAILLKNLNVYWAPAPVVIMGVIATVAGCLGFILPETLGSKLPESIEEALRIGEGSTRGFCTWVYVSPFRMFREEPTVERDVSLENKDTEGQQTKQGYDNQARECSD